MIIHIIQSTVNNTQRVLREEEEWGRLTLLILYLVNTSYRKLIHNSVHKPTTKDVYSDYCGDKLWHQKLSSPVSLVCHADQLGLSGTVHVVIYSFQKPSAS